MVYFPQALLMQILIYYYFNLLLRKWLGTLFKLQRL